MPAGKITISYEDIRSSRVEQRLRECNAVLDDERDADILSPALERRTYTGIFYHAAVYLAIFGLVGGCLGWALGEIVHITPDARAKAAELLDARKTILHALDEGRISVTQASDALGELRIEGQNNAYYKIEDDTSLNDSEKDVRRRAVEVREQHKDLIARILFYGAVGTALAAFLSMADAVVERNSQTAVVNASVGAVMGLFGGVIVSLFMEPLYYAVRGAGAEMEVVLWRQALARAISWGVLGSFLVIAPGLLMRSPRKLLVGVVGGLIGGVIGGLLYDPAIGWTGSEAIGRLIAVVAIGVVGGVATGLVENAAKTGSLKVVAGLIAGKQFVLYRNPTYIGNSLQCHVYLFKDPRVGRRHAAIHLLPSGFEIENLPLGAGTLVNGRSINRSRLHDGDEVQIGSTCFIFQEKMRSV